MKYVTLFPLLLACIFSGSVAVAAQGGPPPGDGPQDERPDGRRPNLLAELGLSREQVQHIRQINQERRPLMMEAQRRMRIANHELDSAIYRDSASDEDFQIRLKEFQAAQAALARLRFESELSVRKVLTSEQLLRFRDLRSKFAEAAEGEMRNHRRRPGGQGAPPPGDRSLGRPPINE